MKEIGVLKVVCFDFLMYTEKKPTPQIVLYKSTVAKLMPSLFHNND